MDVFGSIMKTRASSPPLVLPTREARHQARQLREMNRSIHSVASSTGSRGTAASTTGSHGTVASSSSSRGTITSSVGYVAAAHPTVASSASHGAAARSTVASPTVAATHGNGHIAGPDGWTITDNSIFDISDPFCMSTNLRQHAFPEYAAKKPVQLRDSAEKYNPVNRWQPQPPAPECALNTSALARAFPDFTGGISDESLSMESPRAKVNLSMRRSYDPKDTPTPMGESVKLASLDNNARRRRPSSIIAREALSKTKARVDIPIVNTSEQKENLPPSTKKTASGSPYTSHASRTVSGEQRTLADLHARVTDGSENSFVETRPITITVEAKNTRFSKPKQNTPPPTNTTVEAKNTRFSKPEQYTPHPTGRQPTNTFDVTADTSKAQSLRNISVAQPSDTFDVTAHASRKNAAKQSLRNTSVAHSSDTFDVTANFGRNASKGQALRNPSVVPSIDTFDVTADTSRNVSKGQSLRNPSVAQPAVHKHTAVTKTQPTQQSFFVATNATSEHGTGTVNNGVPVFSRDGKVHIGSTRTTRRPHGLVDGIKVHLDDEDIYEMCDSLKAQVARLETELVQSDELIAAYTERMDNLSTSKQDAQRHIAELTESIANSRELHSAELEEEIANGQEHRKALMEKIAKLEMANAKSQGHRNGLMAKIASLEKKIAGLEENIANGQEHRSDLKERIADLEMADSLSHNTITELEKANSLAHNTIAELERANSLAHSTITELEKAKAGGRHHSALLAQKVASLEKANNASLNTIAELEQVKADNDQHCRSLLKTIADLEAANKHSQGTIAALQQSNLQLALQKEMSESRTRADSALNFEPMVQGTEPIVDNDDTRNSHKSQSSAHTTLHHPIDEELTISHIMPDIEAAKEEMNEPENRPGLTETARDVLDNMCRHNLDNCTRCARMSESGERIPVALPNPIPVSQRTEATECDPDVTQRPFQAPQASLNMIVKMAEDDVAHKKMKLCKAQAAYARLDPSMGMKKRKALEKRMAKLLEAVGRKSDYVYLAYDVVEDFQG